MANLKKVIYINEEDYSTLINGDSLVIDGTTYTYEENALYVIKNAGPPEYAETAGYATNAGTSQVAVTDASGNNIAATYGKKPLVIEVNESDNETTLEQGTYDSITQALTLNKQVILKINCDNSDDEVVYLPLVKDCSVANSDYRFGAVEDQRSYYGYIDDSDYFMYRIVDIPSEIITGQIVGRMHRDNVSGTGNLTITGASGEGFSPNGITTAGKYIVVVYSWSDTKTFGYNISFGGNSYTLSTTDGTISDKRELTVSAGALWSGSVTTAVSAGTTIIVEIYKAEKVTPALSVGMVALTNLYNDLDGKPTISSSTSSTSTTDIASSKAVKLAYDHGGVQSVNGQTGAVSLSLGDTNVIESISVNGVAQTITNKNVDIAISSSNDPFIINIDNTSEDNEGTLTSGTYVSITNALSNNKQVYVKLEDNILTLYMNLTKLGTGESYRFNIINAFTTKYIDISSNDTWTYSDNALAKKDSPTLTGTPAAPTAVTGTNTTLIATTAFVQQELLANGGEENIIETVKVNGTALTPDANKAVDIVESVHVYPITSTKLFEDLAVDTIITGVISTDLDIDIANGKLPILLFKVSLNAEPEPAILGYYGANQYYFYNVFENQIFYLTLEHTSQSTTLTVKERGTINIIKNLTINGSTKNISARGNVNLGTYIESVKVNGTTLTPDSNKAVDISVPTKTSDLTNDSNFTTLSEVTLTIVNSAPTTLDTLNELAAALGNDANFATTVATQIGQKYTKPSTGIPASDLADGVIPTIPVQSVNGQTGVVTVKENVQADWNATSGDAAILNKPDIPDEKLSSSYQTSTLENNNLLLVGGDTYEEAFSKIEKAILDNEETIAASLNDLNTRKIEIDDVPTKTSDLTNDSGFLTSAPVTSVNGATGAVTVKANVQSDWNATTGDAVILNKPTIPAAVTESTVAGWGFTKNTGTITGITMNGASKGTSGVVDLGTVLTSFTETDPTVPTWAKAANKPTYTASEVGALPDTTVIPAAPGTLNTTAITAQSTSSSEALSGNITLHKIAKTGTYSDLIGTPNLSAYVIDYGSSGVGKIHGNVSEIEETRLYAASTTGAYVAVTPGGVDIDTTSLLSFGDVSVTTRTGAKLKYNNNEVATVNQIPTVNNATLTIQKNGTTVDTFTANASSNVTANILVNELPTISSSDNGKVLMVVNGAWAAVTPVTVYTGTSTPNNSLGNNGDLYVLTS